MDLQTLRCGVTILDRCGQNGYHGLTNDSKVVLEIRLGDYSVLAKILCKNISFIYSLGINDLLKKELLRDMRTIRSVLEKSEKEVVK